MNIINSSDSLSTDDGLSRSMRLAINPQCGNCGTHTTIDGVGYCWKCRAPLPTQPADVKRAATRRGIGQAAMWLGGIAAVGATIWWALQ